MVAYISLPAAACARALACLTTNSPKGMAPAHAHLLLPPGWLRHCRTRWLPRHMSARRWRLRSPPWRARCCTAASTCWTRCGRWLPSRPCPIVGLNTIQRAGWCAREQRWAARSPPPAPRLPFRPQVDELKKRSEDTKRALEVQRRQEEEQQRRLAELQAAKQSQQQQFESLQEQAAYYSAQLKVQYELYKARQQDLQDMRVRGCQCMALVASACMAAAGAWRCSMRRSQCALDLHAPCPPSAPLRTHPPHHHRPLQEQYAAEKEDLLDDYRQLTRDIKLKNLVIACFIPPDCQDQIMRHCSFDDYDQSWSIDFIECGGERGCGWLAGWLAGWLEGVGALLAKGGRATACLQAA